MRSERGSDDTINETIDYTYTYDDSGTLTTIEDTSSDDRAKNRREFIYDSDGALSTIESSVEGEDYVTIKEQFTYDDADRVNSYTNETLNGGDEYVTYTYEFDGTKRTTCQILQNNTSEEESCTYSYDDDGYLTKIVNDTTGQTILERDDAVSDTAKGLLVFDGDSHTITYTLDELGNLTLSDLVGDGWFLRSTYTYSTITVDAENWYPSVFSNPSYVPVAYEPDVSFERAAKILGQS